MYPSDGSKGNMPAPPRIQAKDKLKVESLMKRRYSTRIIPPPTTHDPFPPSLGNQNSFPETGQKDSVHRFLFYY